MDVSPDAAVIDVALALRGGGSAWFDDVDLKVIEKREAEWPRSLTPRQLDNVAALSRVVSYVRYLHPSDQAAALDWDAYLPMAMERILNADSRMALLHELRRLVATIAPTIEFAESTENFSAVDIPPRRGAHLVRWWHYGLGDEFPYRSFREGRSELTSVTRTMRLAASNLRTCKRLRLNSKAERSGEGIVTLYLETTSSAQGIKAERQPVVNGEHEVTVVADALSNVSKIEIGISIDGHASVKLQSMSIQCDGDAANPIDFDTEWRSTGGTPHLYTWTVTKCGAEKCGTLARNPAETQVVPERDSVTVDVGAGLKMRMPTAVWTDAQHTLPSRPIEVWPRRFTTQDLPMRLSVVASAWGMLSLFYPYFRDQQLDWDAALTDALNAMSVARSSEDAHDVLSQMIAHLRDDHARVMHPAAPIDGIMPISLRRFGNTLAIVGSLPEYADLFPVGAEVTAIDGIPAANAYERAYRRVSAATQAWRDWSTPRDLTRGRLGEFRRVKIRTVGGQEVEHAIPLVSYDLYADAIKERRPKNGSEIASGVIYVDLGTLNREAWSNLVPVLERARAIVIDLRGYPTNMAIPVLAKLTKREISSPRWQTPVLGGARPWGYQESEWTIPPSAKPLNAPVVVIADGRTVSWGETVLQIIRDNRLAQKLVGEPSGGTNGNVNLVSLPGEFSVRFTGMRVAGPDGTTIHGHGIMPDVRVQPTLIGISAGRDEILEAAVTEAKRVMHK